jgi:dephospho-CoA kinase
VEEHRRFNDRTIDRKKLGDIVFKDREKLQVLMDIVHPVVFEEWKRRVEDISRQDPAGIIIADIPLLIERGWQDSVDIVVLVYVSRDEQIRRLMTRNAFSRPEAEERLNTQIPIDDKILFADFIINNEGTLDSTRQEVDRVWTDLLKLENAKRLKGDFLKMRKKI